jgi:hypothetical protein
LGFRPFTTAASLIYFATTSAALAVGANPQNRR